MAKVKRFRDRRKTDKISIFGWSQGQSNSAKQPEAPEGIPRLRRSMKGPGHDVVTEGPIQGNISGSSSTQLASQPSRHRIRVPGLEAIMARVQRGGELPLSLTPALTASLQRPCQTHRPFFRPCYHPITALPITRSPASGDALVYLLRGITPDPPQPTHIELAGYAGLEDLPILPRIMEHPETDKILSFYFRFNDTKCPAAILLIDPLPGMGKSRYAERERNCCNAGHEAWLYVRKRGDIKWKRDFMAERGSMRQAVYLTRCEAGWRWEQQLGDMLDCRKALNLWIKVKA